MKVHTSSFRIAGTKSPAGFNGKVKSQKSISRHISEFFTLMSIPQKSVIRHVALYSCFLLSSLQERRPARFEEAATEHVEVRAEKARIKGDGLVSPFRALLRDSPPLPREQGNAFSCSQIPHSWESPFMRPIPFRDVLSLRRERRQTRVRPPTTFTGKATGRFSTSGSDGDGERRHSFLAENTPGKRFRIQEERTRKEWEQGSDRRRHAPLWLRYFV